MGTQGPVVQAEALRWWQGWWGVAFMLYLRMCVSICWCKVGWTCPPLKFTWPTELPHTRGLGHGTAVAYLVGSL
jgi:hypothetical protein